MPVPRPSRESKVGRSPPPGPVHSKPLGYAAILTCAVLLGMWATIGTIALATIPALVVAAFTQAVGSVTFAPSLRRLSLNRRQWKLTIVAAVTGAFLAPLAYFVGLSRTTPPDAALLSNTEAMFTVLLAVAVLGERLPGRGYAAVGAILGGAVLVTLDVSASAGEFVPRVVGNLLLVLAAALWALDNTVSRIVTADHDIRAYACVKLGLGSILLGITAFALGQPLTIPPSSLPIALFLGLTGSALFTFLFFSSMRAIGAIRVGAILGTSAAWGVAIAVAAGFPPPTPLQLLGGAVMVLAVLALYLQPHAPISARPATAVPADPRPAGERLEKDN